MNTPIVVTSALILILQLLEVGFLVVFTRRLTTVHRGLVLLTRHVSTKHNGPIPGELEDLMATYIGGSRRAH